MKKSASLVLVAAILACAPIIVWGGTQQPIGCLIQPEQVAEVGSPVVGIVQSMMVERGDTVSKGQIIAILRNGVDRASLTAAHSRATAEAEVRAANANLTFTRQRLTRAKYLHKKKFISNQALDQTVAETKVAQQKLAQALEQQNIWANEASVAEARLADRTIRSPFDGVIAERYISVGERVEERPLVRVAKVDPLRVEVIMPSALFGSVKEGSMASVTPNMAGAAAVSAKVTLVDKILDAASGTFRVRLELPNPDASIPAGLRCKIDFAAETGPGKLPPNKTGTETSLNPATFRMDLELSTPREASTPARNMM